ncbi:hypothetical protein ACJX0J_029211, partial [Zea mays]
MVITDTAKERHKTNSNGMAIWQYGIERHKAALDINYRTVYASNEQTPSLLITVIICCISPSLLITVIICCISPSLLITVIICCISDILCLSHPCFSRELMFLVLNIFTFFLGGDGA